MVTLKDVALLAKVSTATVSRFFSRPAALATGTAARIEQIVAATGYVPNVNAGLLAGTRTAPNARSNMVAVLVPTFSHSIFNDMIEAISTELNLAGVNAMFGLTGTRGEHENLAVTAAIGRRVDAIIITAPMMSRPEALRRRIGTTVIEIWDLPESPIDVAIGFSHAEVGRAIAAFVIERNYQRPHLVTADGTRAAMRRDGFIATWRERSTMPISESRVDIPSRFGHGRRVYAEIRDILPRPDVVICGSDLLAQAVILEAIADGLKVPSDLGVIGFGDNSIAAEMQPTITSVQIDGRRIAREVIAVLRRPVRGGAEEPRRIDVGFRLIARQSA